MEQNFHKKLVDLLKTDPRLLDRNGHLLPSSAIDKAWKMDSRLIGLLLQDDQIKIKFFDQVSDALVFNTNAFIDYISNKNFLSSSYTRFRNKIGLYLGDKPFKETKDISLVWPYKDCILEGGQTKEEETRKEVFFNEVLAEDEINRFFDPKVLTHWKRHTPSGTEKVKEIKRAIDGMIKENLIIKGNNLSVLHTLKSQFLGKIKLIYIDPPYNTGSDAFNYNDAFNHSSWLTFMKNRLEVAKELLKDDGVIFVQCDDKEQAYLKILMDEVLGIENNEVTLYIQVRYKDKSLAEKSNYQKLIEHIFVYSKGHFTPYKEQEKYSTDRFIWKIIELAEDRQITLGGRKVTIFKKGGYKIERVPKGKIGLKETWASGTVLKTTGKFFADHLADRKEQDGLGVLYKVEGIGEDGLGYRYFTGPQRESATKGKFYSAIPLNRQKEIKNGQPIKFKSIANFYDLSAAFGNCRHEGQVEMRGGKKPEQLLQHIIEMSTRPGDLVLDYHLGSGTTVAVAHKMGRQYIGIEQLDYGQNDSIVRLQNVMKGDGSGVSRALKWKGGGDFISCQLMKYNATYIDKIQEMKSSDELVELWKDICQQSFLNWYVNHKRPEKAINDFIQVGKEKGLEAQKTLLTELLNKNQLYVHLSEIEDEDFQVCKEDKSLNKAFFQIKDVKTTC